MHRSKPHPYGFLRRLIRHAFVWTHLSQGVKKRMFSATKLASTERCQIPLVGSDQGIQNRSVSSRISFSAALDLACFSYRHTNPKASKSA
jgi:hypothetical protein